MKRVFVFFLFLIFPFFSFAQNLRPEIEYPTIPGAQFPTSLSPPEKALAEYIKYIFNLGIFIGIILGFFFLVFSGFRYALSMENPQIKADARDQINKTFLGIIILLVSYHLLALISPELVVIEPVSLQKAKLLINFFKRPPKVRNLEEIFTKLYPSAIPLEVLYPEIKGYRPTIIPFVTFLPHYPLNLLIEQYIKFLYNWAIIIGVILTFLVLILNAVKFIFAGGNPLVIMEAKSGFFSAFLGLILLLGSIYILKAFRPEYALIKPYELPEIEIEIPEGVYFCKDRALQLSGERYDLFEMYIINQFSKKIEEKPIYPLDKKLLAELSLWVETFCYRLTNSQNLPVEISGGEEEIEKSELAKIIHQIPGLSLEEAKELLEEIEKEASQPMHYETATHIYINGEYGLILHGKKDFKGRAKMYLAAGFGGYFPNHVTLEGSEFYFYRKYPLEDFFRPLSVTIFEDRVFKCYIEYVRDHPRASEIDLTECLGISRDNRGNPNLEDYSFYFFELPDFGGLEEKAINLETAARVKSFYFILFTFQHFPTPRGEPDLANFNKVARFISEGQVKAKPCDPCESFKVPSEGNWIILSAGGEAENVAVFNFTQRDLASTYARSLCFEHPCIHYIFIWPGAILKPIH